MSFSDLPLISELLTSRTCKSAKAVELCACKFKAEKKTENVTDKRLQHWKEWMKKRKKMHEKLCASLKRDPGSLLMNCADELRSVKEKKLAIEFAKIPQPDPQRGCPGFWKMPLELKDSCGNETSCFAIVSKEEKCEVPILEHVGVPIKVMEEKDILPRKR